MVERGRIKWFNNRAGWGFIARRGAPDVYIHHDQVLGDGFKSLQAGDLVQFTVRKGPRGLFAESVVRLESPARCA